MGVSHFSDTNGVYSSDFHHTSMRGGDEGLKYDGECEDLRRHLQRHNIPVYPDPIVEC